jgi:integrase/recombinase XerD
MSIIKFKRGAKWYVRGTVAVGDRSKSVYESTGLGDETEAEIFRADYENRLLKGLLHGEEYVATFAESVTSYIESGGKDRFIAPILRHFKAAKMRSIGQSDLDKAARTLYPDVSAETRNRQVYTPFIAIWNHAVLNGWADMRKWQRPRRAKGTNVVRLTKIRAGNRPVSYERGAEFVAEMSPAPAMIMTALFYTGMRPIELFGLEAYSVNIAGRWITLDKTKTGEPRGIPMHEFIAPLFGALASRGGFVFRTPRGEAYAAKEDGGGQLKAAIAGARRRSGITDISPYTGRHTASTQLVVNGVHQHIKDQILGHAVDDMSRHYTNVPQAALIEAINTLPVPAAWQALEWWADPLKWSSKLHKNMGHRTDLESKTA